MYVTVKNNLCIQKLCDVVGAADYLIGSPKISRNLFKKTRAEYEQFKGI